MKLDGINSKPHRKKSHREIIDRVIVFCFYPLPGYEHYKLLSINLFHESTHHQAQPHDKPDKTIKCILCKTSKVYNVIFHDCVGGMYAGKQNLHSNDYIHLTELHENIPCIPTYISYDSV